MIGRLSGAIGGALSRLFRPRRVQDGQRGGEKEVISGSAGNVIIVKSPNTEYFKEAIFILCDDLFTRRGVSRIQLLKEARRAAIAYTAAHAPPRSHSLLLRLIDFLLGFLLGTAACWAILTLI